MNQTRARPLSSDMFKIVENPTPRQPTPAIPSPSRRAPSRRTPPRTRRPKHDSPLHDYIEDDIKPIRPRKSRRRKSPNLSSNPIVRLRLEALRKKAKLLYENPNTKPSLKDDIKELIFKISAYLAEHKNKSFPEDVEKTLSRYKKTIENYEIFVELKVGTSFGG